MSIGGRHGGLGRRCLARQGGSRASRRRGRHGQQDGPDHKLDSQMLRHGEDVLVAPSAHVQHDVAALADLVGDLADAGQGMAGLQRGDDPLQLRAQLERLQRLGVGRRAIFGPADVLQPGVLRPDARIVEAGRDRMALQDLAVVVLKQIGAVAVQHAGATALQRGRMVRAVQPAPGRLDADQPHARVLDEGVEQADGVRSAADRRDAGVGQLLAPGQHLDPGLARRSRSGNRAPWPDRGAGPAAVPIR